MTVQLIKKINFDIKSRLFLRLLNTLALILGWKYFFKVIFILKYIKIICFFLFFIFKKSFLILIHH
jgi:hypothetical protein